jgi:hypothetical protein
MGMLKKCGLFFAHSQLICLLEYVNFIAHGKPKNIDMGPRNAN